MSYMIIGNKQFSKIEQPNKTITMKLTIEITSDEKFDRRRLNNLWANCNNEIHQFILHGTTYDLSSLPRMGIKEYSLEVKIKED